jgi:hypothetical protein
MKMRVLATTLLLLALSAPAYAQGDYWFGFAYETSLAQGNASDLVGGLSWRGASFGGRKMIKENVSTGFWAAWHVMDERSVETVGFELQEFEEGLDLTGDFFRYVNSFPIMLNGFYYLGMPGGTRPYAGLNAGVYYIERRVEAGLFAVTRDAWHFGLAPEIGIATPLGWRAAGFGFARFNWAASSGGSGSITYWNFGIGVAWQ